MTLREAGGEREGSGRGRGGAVSLEFYQLRPLQLVLARASYMYVEHLS